MTFLPIQSSVSSDLHARANRLMLVEFRIMGLENSANRIIHLCSGSSPSLAILPRPTLVIVPIISPSTSACFRYLLSIMSVTLAICSVLSSACKNASLESSKSWKNRSAVSITSFLRFDLAYAQPIKALGLDVGLAHLMRGGVGDAPVGVVDREKPF